MKLCGISIKMFIKTLWEIWEILRNFLSFETFEEGNFYEKYKRF